MTGKYKLPKWVWLVLLIPLLIGLYFAENIKGQIRFMQYCWKEGGLKVYEPLERDVGWWAEDLESAKAIASRHPVAFVRYRDDEGDGKGYDVRYIGGSFRDESSYQISPADYENPIELFSKFYFVRMENELRLSKKKYEVYSFEKNELLAGYYVFVYSQYDLDNSFMGAPSNVYCPNVPGFDFHKINEAFKI